MTSVGQLNSAGGGLDTESPADGASAYPVAAASEPGPTDSSPGSVRKDVARNRARILAAADQLVADRGLDLSFNELAHRAGVGVGTVYRHFADRQAVIDAMLESRLEQVIDILRAAMEIPDPGQAFKTAIRDVVRLQARDRGVLACVAPDRIDGEQQTHIREHLKPLLQRIVDRAHDCGWLRADVEITDIPIIFSLVGTLAGQTESVCPDLWARYLDLMLEGMCTPSSNPLSGAAPTVQVLEELGRLKLHRGRSASDSN